MMIEPFQRSIGMIGIARQQKAQYRLAAAVEHLVTARHAIDQDAHIAPCFIFPDDILARGVV